MLGKGVGEGGEAGWEQQDKSGHVNRETSVCAAFSLKPNISMCILPQLRLQYPYTPWLDNP